MADLADFMAPSQAARALDVTPQRVAQLALEGKLPYLSTPLGRLYARADVERLAAERAALRSRPA